MILILNLHVLHIKLPFPIDLLPYCHVTLFFAVAGYTYRHKEETYGAFCRKKAARLLMPYLLYSVTAFVLYCPQLIEKGIWQLSLLGIAYGRNPVRSGEDVCLINFGNGPMWFLPAMFFGYALFRWVMILSPKRRMLSLLVCFALPVGACYIPFLMPWSIDVAGFAALCMCGGYWMKEHVRLNARWLRVCTTCLAACIFIGTGLALGRVNVAVSLYGNEYLSPPAVAVVCYMVMTLAALYVFYQVFSFIKETWISRFFAWCGRMSLTLLCTHIYSSKLISHLLNRMDWPLGIIAMCYLIFMLLSAWLWFVFCRRFESRWPILQYL